MAERANPEVPDSGVSALASMLVPPNKAMKLTRLSAAPGWLRGYQTRGAASCAHRYKTVGTASQLMRRVLRTRWRRCDVKREV
jgi:hypothetical protein